MNTSCSESSLLVNGSFDIRTTRIFQDYLHKSVEEVKHAAKKANVSPSGFQIDESFCDCGEIETSNVTDLVDEAGQHFGLPTDSNYQYIVRALTDAITEAFASKE